ncbi:hypothetical protein LB504_003995 [Fusarium proliferatum]|nr:hypothetical protein LB504_003995 [Fusarium proliferatum]
MAVHCSTSSPTTAVAHSAAPYTRLPLEIELHIVQALIEMHKRSKRPGFRLSTFASVSKAWQALIEKETYKDIKISSDELYSFKYHVGSYRKLLVHHILLEISYNVYSHGVDDQVRFSKAVYTLWRILSRWNTHRVTVELGIASTQLTKPPLVIVPPNSPFNPLKTLHPRLVATVNDWVRLSQCYLGREAACFDRTFFPPEGATSLPQVDAIAELVVRREYFPNISPITLHEIISSAPCIESIHLERWCYGVPAHDRKWDRALQRSGFLVSESTKRFTYFEEFNTPFHQRAGAMIFPRPYNTLLESILHAADRLEHIAVSFAFDAQTFFESLKRAEFKVLRTLALTSSSSKFSKSLLLIAAETVKKLRALKILEIWNFDAGQADVFRYERRLDRYQGQITWQSTKDRQISSSVEKGWKDLLSRGENGFDVKCSNFSMEMESLRDLLPHLKLGEQILRHFTER